MFCFQPWSEEKNEWISASNITRSYRQRIVILCAAATKIKLCLDPKKPVVWAEFPGDLGGSKPLLVDDYIFTWDDTVLPFLLYGMCWGLCFICALYIGDGQNPLVTCLGLANPSDSHIWVHDFKHVAGVSWWRRKTDWDMIWIPAYTSNIQR